MNDRGWLLLESSTYKRISRLLDSQGLRLSFGPTGIVMVTTHDGRVVFCTNEEGRLYAFIHGMEIALHGVEDGND